MKYIFTGFSPNTRSEDVRRAFLLVISFQWKRYFGDGVKKLEQWFQEYFSVSYAIGFDSGRTALHMSLRTAGIGVGDEVIVQGFTCIVVSTAVTSTGATPIYVDCNEEYVLDASSVEKKITPKTKAIIIQHTFGQPADVVGLVDLAKKHNLITIEDCAHSLGGKFNDQLLGTFADLAMFSFGSDKVISGVRGGMVITNNPEFGKKLKHTQTTLPLMPITKELQHLNHPFFFWLGRKTYHLYIGKIILFVAQKLHLINRIIYRAEKEGKGTGWFPAQLPNTLAELAFEQIKNLDTWNLKRQNNVAYYREKLLNKKNVQKLGTAGMWLRFPIEVNDPRELKKRAQAQNIMLGDWYSTPIAPADSSLSAAQYQLGSCPNVEKICTKIINLPTDPSLSHDDLERILQVVCL